MDLKEYAERATGIARSGELNASELARARKPHAIRFKDDGLVLNHPRWPLIIYRGAVDLNGKRDPAAVMEDLFEANGWSDTWRDGIYDYVHYHSRIHEVLGITRGKGCVRFGGNKGRIFTLKAGDGAVLPAGTGYQCLPDIRRVHDRHPSAVSGGRPGPCDGFGIVCRADKASSKNITIGAGTNIRFAVSDQSFPRYR